MSHHHTARLAEFAATLRYGEIPDPVVERVKLLALDSLGCGLLGATMPWSQRLRDTLIAIEAPGQSRVWGTDHRFSAPSAAMANATAVHGFELDDVSHGGHHGSVVMTSALAIADHRGGLGLSGQDLIAALVAGVEVASRVQSCVGRVPQVTLGFHGPGVVGTFAAAASAGRALGLDTSQVVDAFGHAGQQTGGLMATQHGGMGKRLLAGKAAHSGTLAALLAAHGFTNVPDIFECEYGGFCSTFTGGGSDYRLDELTRGLGSEWRSAELNFKMWPCRVPIHPTLEAIRSLQVEHAFKADQVRRVRVWLDEGAYKAVGWPWAPTTQTSAQLNLTYCAAQLILEGDVFVEQFAVEKLGHPRVMEMTSRIECIHDREMDAFGTFQQRTRVEVELADGRVLGAIGRTRGTTADNQLTDKPIREKFVKVTSGLLSDTAQAALIEDCERLDTLDDVCALADQMRHAAVSLEGLHAV
jgi:2-methylcitrate dehydratase PrpD